MARPDERRFVTFKRGSVRDDIILARFRNVLRAKVNPDTGVLFTEAEIAYITQEDSRFFIEADGIDLFGQAVQQRAIWFADQVRPERAASEYLRRFHGELWIPEGKLDATGGSGSVTVTGNAGTIYVGSTIVGDPTANRVRDPAGKQYQVLSTAQIPIGQRTATLQFIGVDGGDSTNPRAGTELVWQNPPIGSAPTCVVLADFTGGFDKESDAEYAKRILQRIRNKPGAGNSAQFRIWAQSANVAVEDAFIYPCAFHTGSVLVVISQKRGTTVGPLARIASVGTLAVVTSFLVPPSTPVVPHGTHVLVTPLNPEPVNFVMQLSMPRGSSGGWTDVDPWPRYSSAYSQGVLITSVTSQTSFRVQTTEPLTGAPLSGAAAPALSVWNPATSEFVSLDVNTVSFVSGETWNITLNNPPSFTLTTGIAVCPKNERASAIREAFEDYFDELGPGEAVVATDLRYVRAARFPRPDQEYSTRAGQSIIARLDDQLGGALADAELSYISQQTPNVPNAETELALGTNVLTLNRAAIYAFNS